MVRLTHVYQMTVPLNMGVMTVRYPGGPARGARRDGSGNPPLGPSALGLCHKGHSVIRRAGVGTQRSPVGSAYERNAPEPGKEAFMEHMGTDCECGAGAVTRRNTRLAGCRTTAILGSS